MVSVRIGILLFLVSVGYSHQFDGVCYVKIGDCRTRFSVRPSAGKAILFYSQNPDGSKDSRSLHGACPVLVGDKWAGTWTVTECECSYLRFAMLHADVPFTLLNFEKQTFGFGQLLDQDSEVIPSRRQTDRVVSVIALVRINTYDRRENLRKNDGVLAPLFRHH